MLDFLPLLILFWRQDFWFPSCFSAGSFSFAAWILVSVPFYSLCAASDLFASYYAFALIQSP
jgi:hypothetical protein